jgi:hypothetical protein
MSGAMKRLITLVSLLLTPASVALAGDPPAARAPAPAAKAPATQPAVKPPVPPTPPAPAPELKRTMLAFLGSWSFKGTLSVPGQDAPIAVTFRMPCKKIAGGRGAECTTRS